MTRTNEITDERDRDADEAARADLRREFPRASRRRCPVCRTIGGHDARCPEGE